MNPIRRIIILSIFLYFFMVFGNTLTYNTLLLTLGYNSNFRNICVTSFKLYSLLYFIMISSLVTCPEAFNLEFYIFSVFIGLYINGIMASCAYLVYNLFIPLPTYINALIFCLFTFGLTLLGIYYESHTFVDKQTIQCENLEGNITLAHLTDVHLGAIYGKKFVQKLVNIIINQNVDFVVITGDLIDGNIKVKPEMLEPFKLLNCPIYYVTGNHEDYTWKEEAMQIIRKSPITHLENEKVVFDNRINIIGVDFQTTDSAVSTLESLSSNNPEKLPNIFLYHVPIFRPVDLIGVDVFLFLCGHLHGGAFFPFTFFTFLLRKKFIIEGLYSYMNKHFVYCCSGQGTSGPAIRTGSKSKIGIIQIIGKK